MSWWFVRKRKSIAEISNEIHVSFEELKKRTRIAVIDDDINSLPIESLKQDNFAIDTYETVDALLLQKLERGYYDIIILDIKGIASVDIVKNDGLGILQYLKEKNPTQIIVACSSKKFDPSQCKFFNLANDVLDKPITFIECKEKLEQIISDNMSIENRWNALTQYLRSTGIGEKTLNKIEKSLIHSLCKKKSTAEKILQHMDEHAPAYTLALQIINFIVNVGK